MKLREKLGFTFGLSIIFLAVLIAPIQASASVSYLTLSPTTINIYALNSSSTSRFTVTAHFSDGTTANVTTSTYWSTNNTSVAWVADRSDGTAYSRGSYGTATITAYYPYGAPDQKTAQVKVNVVNPNLVTSLSITPSSMKISGLNATGGRFTVYAKYANGTTANVTTSTYWSTNNTSVAWVADRSDGTAYSRGSYGTATITAYFPYGAPDQKTTQVKVSVIDPYAKVVSLSITPSSMNISTLNSTGGRFKVIANYSDYTTKDVTTSTYWSTSSPSVAWVADRSNGTAYSKGSYGTATITAYFPYGTPEQKTAQGIVNVGSSLRSRIVANAKTYLGYAYVYGVFDCSKFTQVVFSNNGIYLPRTTSEQVQCGTAISTSQLQPGDLIFYYSNGHVGIYIGNGQVIHNNSKAGYVKIDSYTSMPISACRKIVN